MSTALHPLFHGGELAVQRRAGTRGVADELGLFMGTSVDTRASSLLKSLQHVWVSVLSDDKIWVFPIFGMPGFLTAEEGNKVHIHFDSSIRETYDSIFFQNIHETPMSLLALEVSTRRRYRINGRLDSVHENSNHNSLSVSVREAFPNCPKYINLRHICNPNVTSNCTSKWICRDSLSDEDMKLVKQADTLFLGTYYAATGMDINHRGGQPGFIKTEGNKSISWEDYRGNGMFQSTGNLACDSRAAVSILDFSTGILLMLSGHANVVWNDNNTNRIMKFNIEHVRRSVTPVTEYRWRLIEISPYNPDVSGMKRKDGSIFPMNAKLVKISNEAQNVKTFRFLLPEKVKFLPGQYATFEFQGLKVGREETPVRTWTLSEISNSVHGDVTLEISVKKKTNGIMSTWLHEHVTLGHAVNVRGIAGEMTPFSENSTSTPRSILFISAGIGITPCMAILRGLGAWNSKFDHVWFMHQDRRLCNIPFAKEIDRRSGASKVSSVFYLTKEDDDYSNDLKNVQVKKRRIDLNEISTFVTQKLILGSETYLCGPQGFMNDVTEALLELGVDADNIITEKFDF